MRIHKLLFLPLIFTLSSCANRNSSNKNAENTATYKDPEVAKISNLSTEKKQEILDNTKNVFVRNWMETYTEDINISLDEKINNKDSMLYTNETLVSFEKNHLEERLIENIDGQNYALDFIIDKVNGKYNCSGAYSVFVENIFEGADLNEYFQLLCESTFEQYKQTNFLPDSIPEYINGSCDTANDMYGGSDLISSSLENLRKGLLEKLVCLENDSKGNCVLNLSGPIKYFDLSMSSGGGFVSKGSCSLDAMKLYFKDYRLDKSAMVMSMSITYTGEGYSNTTFVKDCSVSTYGYNVDENNCFSNVIPVLTIDELMEVLKNSEQYNQTSL